MAVDTIQEAWSGQEVSEQSQDGQVGIRRSRRKLTVTVTDSVNDTEMTVRAAAGVPKVGEVHPRAASQICVNVSVSRPSLIMYEVNADYQVSVTSIGPGSGDEGPVGQPPVINFDSIETEEQIDQDADDNPIMTVAGEPFDPPVTREFSDGVIRLQVFMSNYDESFYSAFRNTVNNATFWGMPAGTVKCKNISATSTYANGAPLYFEVNFEFHTRRGAPNTTDEKAWYKRIRAEGFYYLEGGLTPTRCVDDAGEPTVTPVLHNVNTGAIITDPANAQWYEFKVFPTADFSLLGVG